MRFSGRVGLMIQAESKSVVRGALNYKIAKLIKSPLLPVYFDFWPVKLIISWLKFIYII